VTSTGNLSAVVFATGVGLRMRSSERLRRAATGDYEPEPRRFRPG
jgi:hypothetical protein